MKKRTLLTCGLAAALFAGCSSDDKLTVDDGTVSNGGSGYLALNVSLPTTGNAPRAIGANNQSDDQYNQGAANEYAVNTIHLVCYDASGKAVQAFEYTGDAWSTPPAPANGITTESVLKVQPVQSDVAQILVLVNAPSTLKFKKNAENKLTGEMAYNSDTYVSTYDDFKKFKFTDDVTGGGSSFFMSNSPLSDGTKLTELVNVVPQNTMEAAMADMRTVNVERAAGKVSLAHQANKSSSDTNSPGWNEWEYTLDASGYKKDKVTFNSWMLDVTNKVTYPVRHYTKDWEAYVGYLSKQRFKGTSVYEGNTYAENANGTYYRTYWAEDPNYGSYIEGDFNKVELLTQFTANSLSTPLYCNENTFDVYNMQQRQSTRVILKATYKPYNLTIGSDGNWYRIGNSNKAYNLSDINTLIQKIKSADGGATWNCASVELDASSLEAGSNELDNTNFGTTLDATHGAEQVTAINKVLGTVTVYKNCECYYVARIQHFGSYYTPWGIETGSDTYFTQYYNYTGSLPSGKTESDLNKAYLGRYGIVRNNWYELELGEVSAPGEPTIPTASAGTDPDDEEKYYIQATVKIMDWAVRKQSVNL